jgi:hypothetical protein
MFQTYFDPIRFKHRFLYSFEFKEQFQFWLKQNNYCIRLKKDDTPLIYNDTPYTRYKVSIKDGVPTDFIIYFGDQKIDMTSVEVFIVLPDYIDLSKYWLLGIL